MTTYELSAAQFEELRDSVFTDIVYYDGAENADDFAFPADIPDDVVHGRFEGINFVDDDFLCTSEVMR